LEQKQDYEMKKKKRLNL